MSGSFLSFDSVISLLRVSIGCWDSRSACSISSGDTLTSGHPDMKREVVLILLLTLTSTLNPPSPHLPNVYLLSQHCSKHGQIEVSPPDAILVGRRNAFSFFLSFFKSVSSKEKRAGFLCVQDKPLCAAFNAGSLESRLWVSEEGFREGLSWWADETGKKAELFWSGICMVGTRFPFGLLRWLRESWKAIKGPIISLSADSAGEHRAPKLLYWGKIREKDNFQWWSKQPFAFFYWLDFLFAILWGVSRIPHSLLFLPSLQAIPRARFPPPSRSPLNIFCEGKQNMHTTVSQVRMQWSIILPSSNAFSEEVFFFFLSLHFTLLHCSYLD